MAVGEALEDLDLALQVIEELRTEPTPINGLDRDLVVCLLYDDTDNNDNMVELGGG